MHVGRIVYTLTKIVNSVKHDIIFDVYKDALD